MNGYYNNFVLMDLRHFMDIINPLRLNMPKNQLRKTKIPLKSSLLSIDFYIWEAKLFDSKNIKLYFKFIG